MKLKLPKNPQQAYMLGFRNGQTDGLNNMFLTHLYVLLPAMYNAKDDEIISDEYFGKYAKAVEAEIQNILNECFDGDVTKVQAMRNYKEELLEDRVKYLLTRISEMRQKCGLDKI